MKKKILFFDIDGTLINSAQEMPDSAARALRKAREEGHILCLCTGRSYGQLIPLLLNFGFDAIVAASGSYVRVGDEVIYHHRMDAEQVVRIVAYIESKQGSYFCQNASSIVLTAEHARRMEERMINQMHVPREEVLKMRKSNRIVEHIRDGADDVEKLLFFDLFLPLEEIQAGVGENIAITTNSYETAPEGSGELTVRGIHKGTGMQVLLDYYGMSREDVIAFGDSGNDTEMIEFAGYGVVMGNGSPELKKLADMVTDAIWDDGLAKALYRLGLCGEEKA